MALETNVYVDGFNLYYGCVKDTPYRWLDLAAFCARLLPHNQINHIRYFTASLRLELTIHSSALDRTYLRALRTIPNLSVYTSHFLASKVWMKRANDPGYVRVLKSEEKGSDVNLASALLIDCDRSDCDIAVIVSNDSDLTFPIEHVKRHLGKIIGIINPHKRPSRELLEFLQIRPSERACSMSISNEAH
jgi:uncharacterized LabA/DUF88 family protein